MKKIEEIIGDASSVTILGHVHPDGDCVGACLGVYNYLQTAAPDIPVRICLEPFSDSFLFLRGADQISHEFAGEETCDLCLVLDVSDRGRLGDGAAIFDRAKRTVCIDHHISNEGFADENLIDPEVSSASELVTGHMDPVFISRETAECLYLGIVHDTGVFKHSNTTEATMRIAGMLLSKGVSSAKIIDDTFYKKSFVQNRMMGQALLRAELFLSGAMIGSFMKMEDMERLGGGPKDMDGIIDQLRVTDGVETAALIYETSPGHFKISLRSNQRVDVSRIASAYGGGGHIRAAGGSTDGDPAEILRDIAGRVRSQMEEG